MEASTPPHGRCLSLSPTRSTPVARGPHERRYTRYVAIHPIRRDAPVTSRCTRSEEVQCLRIGCIASHNKPNRGQFAPTDPNRPPRTLRHSFDMLARLRTRGATPVTSQYTRYVSMHPIRRGAMPTDRVHRHLTTSPIEEKLVLTAPTSPNRAAADSATPLSNMPPSGSIVPSATSYAWRSVLGRRSAPAYSPSAPEAPCFARSVSTRSTTRGRRAGVSRWR